MRVSLVNWLLCLSERVAFAFLSLYVSTHVTTMKPTSKPSTTVLIIGIIVVRYMKAGPLTWFVISTIIVVAGTAVFSAGVAVFSAGVLVEVFTVLVLDDWLFEVGAASLIVLLELIICVVGLTLFEPK